MTTERTSKPYDVRVPVAARRDVVWRALTQPRVLRQWFGWDYDGLDAEIRHIFIDQAALLGPEQMGWADGSYLEVTGDDDASTIRVTREGRPPADPDRYDAVEEAWKAFLVQLRFLLERKPKGARRTLHLTGETTGRQVLELVDGEWQRAGTRVASIVDPDGHLVVAATHVPLDDHAASATQIVVSTYGLDDEAFTVTREQWTKRWAPIADRAEVTFAPSD